MLICSPFIIFIDSFTSNKWHTLVTEVLVSSVDSVCLFSLRCLYNSYKIVTVLFGRIFICWKEALGLLLLINQVNFGKQVSFTYCQCTYNYPQFSRSHGTY